MMCVNNSKKRFGRILRVVAIASSLIGAYPATAGNPVPGTAPVTIVSPLPLPISGDVGVSGSVAATQSGKWTVDVNATQTPVRFGPVEGLTPPGGNPSIIEVVPSVEDGKIFVLTDLHVLVDSNVTLPFVSGTYTVWLTTADPQGGTITTRVLRIPLEGLGTVELYGSLQVFIPLNTEEKIEVGCYGTAAITPSIISQNATVTAGGYFLPAAQ